MDSSQVDPDILAYLKGIAEGERDNTIAKATMTVGPYTAFCMISALQVAKRHPGMTGGMKTQLNMITNRMKIWFKNTPVEELLNRGDHPEWDLPLDEETPDAPSD